MHILRQYVNRIEGLNSLIEQVAKNPVTQGVLLDINPIWLWAYRLSRAGLRPEHIYDWFLDRIWAPPISLESIEGDAIDFDWNDALGVVRHFTDNWINQYENNDSIPDSMLPFIVKIITKPVTSEYFETREQLVELARRQNFFTIVETRSLGRLAASSGDACLANGVPGTIGGFLRDQNTGIVYAATCGHVAAKNAQVTVNGNILGVCLFSHPPRPLPTGQPCTHGSLNANRLDLALIDLGNSSPTNIVSGLASQIASHQKIVLRGGMTQVNTFEVGGLMLTYCPGNSNVCFENMFEVRPVSTGGILNPSVRTAFSTVPTQGDSGAWIETIAGEWCGILVATDHLMGYALEADDSLVEFNGKFRTKLQLA
jgi:hypothetical protein